MTNRWHQGQSHGVEDERPGFKMELVKDMGIVRLLACFQKAELRQVGRQKDQPPDAEESDVAKPKENSHEHGISDSVVDPLWRVARGWKASRSLAVDFVAFPYQENFSAQIIQRCLHLPPHFLRGDVFIGGMHPRRL